MGLPVKTNLILLRVSLMREMEKNTSKKKTTKSLTFSCFFFGNIRLLRAQIYLSVLGRSRKRVWFLWTKCRSWPALKKSLLGTWILLLMLFDITRKRNSVLGRNLSCRDFFSSRGVQPLWEECVLKLCLSLHVRCSGELLSRRTSLKGEDSLFFPLLSFEGR
jgi:hypothetical protein